MIHVRSFESWREMKLRTVVESEDIALETMVECGTCGGCGEIEDIGEKTGRYFDTDCPTCDGDGKVEISRQNAESAIYTKDDYETEVKMDLQMLSAWTLKPYWLVLFDAGFEVTFSLDKRELHARLDRLPPSTTARKDNE